MGILTEENGVYGIDCSKALWATDEIHEAYKATGSALNDVDFVLETETSLLMIEYKNAAIEGASKPEAFEPNSDKKINNVVKKFYDSLHYLTLKGKVKSKEYIYILEYPLGDSVSRRFVRNKLQAKLPFGLQSNMGNGIRLLEKIEVLSIEEWNNHTEYGKYPIKLV